MHGFLLVTAGLMLAGSPATTAAEYVPWSMTGSPALHEMIVTARDKLSADGGLGVRTQAIGPDSPWGVTDYGRVSVVRDVTGAGFGTGNDMFQVFDGTIDAVNAYYEAHPDADPQFVVVITDWLITTGGAFYMPIANDVTGIGYDGAGAGSEVFDTDSTTAVEGLVWLNGLDLYTTGQGGFFAGLLFGQEFGHRWLSFVQFQDSQGNTRNDLLGRDDAHWSYYLDTDWSWVEGNDWINNGDGTFTTDHSSFDSLTHYSDLDLYLMGLLPAAQVPDMLLINAPQGGPSAAASPSAWGGGGPVTVTGTAETVTAQMIVDEEGPRVPDSTASQKAFDLQVLLVLRQNDRINEPRITELNAVLDTFQLLWETDVRGLATADFVFSGTPNLAPEVSVVFPSGGRVGEKLVFDATGSTDPEGAELTYQWDWGNDGTFSSTQARVEYEFPAAGSFTVRLRVVDENGGEALEQQSIRIEDEPEGCGCTVAQRAPRRYGLPALGLLLAAGLIAGRRRLTRRG